jgi:cytosolic 5'-nucleotidase 3
MLAFLPICATLVYVAGVRKRAYASTTSATKLRAASKIIKKPTANPLINHLIEKGPSALQICIDFDRTITTFYGPNGKKGASCHGIIESNRPEQVAKVCKELNEKYYPIEVDPKLTREEKIPFMIEWYELVNEQLVLSNIYKKDIKQAVSVANVQLRRGIKELFDFATIHKVPTIIFSAGITDILKEVIEQKYGKLPDNFDIVSNDMVWDENEKHVGWAPDLIHMFNKNELHLKGRPLFEQLKQKKSVILIGDSLGDVTMAEGTGADHVLKIGLLNDNVDGLLSQYEEAYDVILTEDAPLDFVTDLCAQIASSPVAKGAAAI